MAKQVINIGTVANDGTGDPLRTAFDKVNDNFTELYNDDAGDVDSVNGQTGTVVLDTDDISEGASNLYNATHTGDVTGATALTIATGAVSYTKLENRMYATTSGTLTTSYTADWSTFKNWDLDNAVASTITFTNPSEGEVKNLVITSTDGASSIAFSATSNLYNIVGEYDATLNAINLVQVLYAGGVFFISISQATAI